MLGAVLPVRALRFAVFTVTATATLVALSDGAHARWNRYRTYIAYQPKYSAIVIDANSGKELHAANADALRHPASLTKIMTLYLLFEQLESGKLKLDTPMRVSDHASDQSPTRIGLDPGEMLKVEDAIKALVTRSANDAAVVVAETIGGTEENFAKLMTRKAHALGMTHTVYMNASGLPDDDQVTTARDQAQLGRAIQDRFPQYYKYFSTASFVYQGQFMGNHNRLLGNVDGVDGIKTGYTRNSGFNLVTSVRRGNRFLVAVVLGGPTAGARDARMRQLIEEYIGRGAPIRTAAKIIETPESVVRLADQRPQPRLPVEAPVAVAELTDATAPVQPARAKMATAKAGTTSIGSLLAPTPQATVPPKDLSIVRRDDAPNAPAQEAEGDAAEPTTYDVASVSSTPVTLPPAPAPAKPQAPAAAPTVKGAWMIQVGAFPEEAQAKERLRAAQTVGKSVLSSANGFTEKVVVKGRTALYRARFVGLKENAAQAACKVLKRGDIACLAMKN